MRFFEGERGERGGEGAEEREEGDEGEEERLTEAGERLSATEGTLTELAEEERREEGTTRGGRVNRLGLFEVLITIEIKRNRRLFVHPSITLQRHISQFREITFQLVSEDVANFPGCDEVPSPLASFGSIRVDDFHQQSYQTFFI
jgi:hypothetical protein